MPEITGTCLCGSISYKCLSSPLRVSVCHCKSCQHQTGTSFSTIVVVAKNGFSLVGEENLGEFVGQGDSGKKVRRKFCKNCGSPLFSLVDMAPDIIAIKAGTLNDKSWLKPTLHTWCDHAQPWIEIDENMPQFERNPPAK